MEASDAVCPAAVQEDAGAEDVCLQKQGGVFDGPVHVGFGGEVYHHVRVLFFEEAVHRLPVTDVALHEAEPGAVHHRGEVGQVRSVGEFVQAQDPEVFVGFHHIENKVGADKSGAAGNENGHGGLLGELGLVLLVL